MTSSQVPDSKTAGSKDTLNTTVAGVVVNCPFIVVNPKWTFLFYYLVLFAILIRLNLSSKIN